jgi:hypothetical protein
MLQQSISYRWYQPDSGPAKTGAELALWAPGVLLALPGIIYANQRDVIALRGTMLAGRVELPPHGVVQAGTVWVAEAVQ